MVLWFIMEVLKFKIIWWNEWSNIVEVLKWNEIIKVSKIFVIIIEG